MSSLLVLTFKISFSPIAANLSAKKKRDPEFLWNYGSVGALGQGLLWVFPVGGLFAIAQVQAFVRFLKVLEQSNLYQKLLPVQ